MSSAKATGSSANGNANATHRTHNDGSAGRAYTDEQRLAVIRVRKCQATAFYDILGLEAERTTVDDSGIKKAYRKLSLLTHPDKNGYPGADEAFKMVSRAFQILSDADKKKRFDQFGGDPDNRFSASGASSPFAGFASPGAGRGQMFEDEISPEELFRQFFAGGMGGPFGGPLGGGMFNMGMGPGFMFNLGGGPGIRVHQFGGPRVRRRPPGARPEADQTPPFSALQSLLPLLLLLLLPLLSSFFSQFTSGDAGAARNFPRFTLDTPNPPYTQYHLSSKLNIPYYVNPSEVNEWNSKKWEQMDQIAENALINQLQIKCERERRTQDQLLQEAQGWFLVDHEKMKRAERMDLKNCRRLEEISRALRFW